MKKLAKVFKWSDEGSLISATREELGDEYWPKTRSSYPLNHRQRSDFDHFNPSGFPTLRINTGLNGNSNRH
ncbi:MAG: hypothetical protein GY839_21390 [candidate division Zixibacteria bacterium]|nr:hypothetical protein [candidate division Zixibacteria bacterium]